MRVSPVVFARVILIAAIIALGVVAFVTQSLGNGAGASPQPPTAVVAVAPPRGTPPPTPRPQPTQTPQAITSIILRETPVPYPTSTPLPANQPMVSVVDFSYTPGIVRIKAGQTVMWR